MTQSGEPSYSFHIYISQTRNHWNSKWPFITSSSYKYFWSYVKDLYRNRFSGQWRLIIICIEPSDFFPKQKKNKKTKQNKTKKKKKNEHRDKYFQWCIKQTLIKTFYFQKFFQYFFSFSYNEAHSLRLILWIALRVSSSIYMCGLHAFYQQSIRTWENKNKKKTKTKKKNELYLYKCMRL